MQRDEKRKEKINKKGRRKEEAKKMLKKANKLGNFDEKESEEVGKKRVVCYVTWTSRGPSHFVTSCLCQYSSILFGFYLAYLY